MLSNVPARCLHAVHFLKWHCRKVFSVINGLNGHLWGPLAAKLSNRIIVKGSIMHTVTITFKDASPWKVYASWCLAWSQFSSRLRKKHFSSVLAPHPQNYERKKVGFVENTLSTDLKKNEQYYDRPLHFKAKLFASTLQRVLSRLLVSTENSCEQIK